MDVSTEITIFATEYIREVMKKRTIMLLASALFMLTAPMSIMAYDADQQVVEQQIDNREITITVEQSTLLVNNAAGLTLEVVSLTGKQVAVVKIESPAQRVELSVPKGCYIVKVGKIVRKVAIR